MSKFSLVPYTLRLRHKKSSQYLSFGNVSQLDFLNVVYDYLKTVLSGSSININNGEVLKVNNLFIYNRIITGRFDAGENGYGSKLLDITTDTISYERNPLEAELIPYYFLIALPEIADRGIAIFQKFKNFGVKEIFFENFYQYVKDCFGDEYVLEMNPLIPKELIKSYVDGRVVKLRLIKQGFPRDMFDVSQDCLPDEESFEGNCELVLSAPRNGFLPDRFRSLLSKNLDKFLENGDEKVSSVIEVKNFDFDNIKIQVRVGNSYRTIDLSDTNKLRYSEDISGIAIDNNGHPKFDIIDSIAKSLLKDLADSIWGGNVNV